VTPEEAVAFVEHHGVVLQSARGPVPSLAEAIAGGPIRGSWWGHPKGHDIFRASEVIGDSADVLVCKLVTPLIAETTTTTRFPWALQSATRWATALILSMEPTEVPPYF
jgi:hypothetical protein